MKNQQSVSVERVINAFLSSRSLLKTKILSLVLISFERKLAMHTKFFAHFLNGLIHKKNGYLAANCKTAPSLLASLPSLSDKSDRGCFLFQLSIHKNGE